MGQGIALLAVSHGCKRVVLGVLLAPHRPEEPVRSRFAKNLGQTPPLDEECRPGSYVPRRITCLKPGPSHTLDWQGEGDSVTFQVNE